MLTLKRLAAVAITGLLGTATAGAEDQAMLELATESGCFVCHQLKSDPNIPTPLAPSYEQVAARYENQPKMHDELVDRVLHGTVYKTQHWEGAVNMRFMPPNVNVDRSTAERLVNWIMNLNIEAHEEDELQQHEEALNLATVSGCMTCHRVDPIHEPGLVQLAPSYREIAGYYDGSNGAKAYLQDSILHGTLNKAKVWTNVNMRFMPPNVALKKEDADTLTSWILGLEHDGVKLPASRHAPDDLTSK